MRGFVCNHLGKISLTNGPPAAQLASKFNAQFSSAMHSGTSTHNVVLSCKSNPRCIAGKCEHAALARHCATQAQQQMPTCRDAHVVVVSHVLFGRAGDGVVVLRQGDRLLQSICVRAVCPESCCRLWQ